MIVELIITALFTIGVVYSMMDYDKVWVLEKDGDEYKPALKHRKDLAKDQEYSTDYSAVFKWARIRNFWKTNRLIK